MPDRVWHDLSPAQKINNKQMPKIVSWSERGFVPGKQIGRLTIISTNPDASVCLCRCSCGNETTVRSNSLWRGLTRSCGCLRKQLSIQRFTKHGKTHSRVFRLWANIKNRCFNPSAACWKDYGGRGISMHPEWAESFESFYKYLGDPPAGATLDRINNDGNYEPGNVRFASMVTQQNNKRTNVKIPFNGEIHTISEWSRIRGIDMDTLYRRIINYHWPVKRAMTTPVREHKEYKNNNRNKMELNT